MQAWANAARYTPADQMLSPERAVRGSVNGGMETTAEAIRINRATGDAFADGDVKSTYSELKEQPDGALLASSSPIHVTARTMTAHTAPGTSPFIPGTRVYGRTRMSLRRRRSSSTAISDSVTAQGTSAQPVQTILVQNPRRCIGQRESGHSRRSDKDVAKARQSYSPRPGSSPIAITATKLTYADSERKVHYEGGVIAKGADFTASAKPSTLISYREAKRSNQSRSCGARTARSYGRPRRCGDHSNPTAAPTGRSWSTPPPTTSLS